MADFIVFFRGLHQVTKIRSFLISLALAMSTVTNSAHAHVLSTFALPIHHSTLFTGTNKFAAANVNKIFTGTGSLSTRTFNAMTRTLIFKSYSLGQAAGLSSVSSSPVVTGGQIQGTLYVSLSIGGYVSVGGFTGTLNSTIAPNVATSFIPEGTADRTPGFQNSVTFTPTISNLSQHNTGLGFFKLTGSGSQRAYESLLSPATSKAYSLGQQVGLQTGLNNSSFSKLLGGEFTGTFYQNGTNIGTNNFIVPTNGTFSGRFIFAFGNNTLNTPIGFGNLVPTPASLASYLQLGNGTLKSITDGQLLFPLTGGVGSATSVFAIGANPANTGILGSRLFNPISFLFF